MKRKWNWLMASVLAVSLLAGCGAAGGMKAESSASMDLAKPEMSMPMEAPVAVEEAFDSGTGAVSVQRQQTQGEKLIYTADLQMETTEFDRATEAIQALTAECVGYFESSSVSSWGRGYRDASYTVRVPAERYRDFLDRAGELCHVLNRQEYTDNVTEAYYDVDGRLRTQQTKLERLQELLARAESMEDIITIESAISDTEAQIESLSGQLRRYDALVDYSTVNIYVNEVYKLSNVEEAPTTFWSRLSGAFADGWRSFTDGMEDLAVGLAYSWMWLVLLAVIVIAAAALVRKRLRKKRTALAKKADDKPEQT